MGKLKVLDLFSGIGGFSLGLERTGGFETVAFCEIEKFPQQVLKKHWPDVPIYEDVRNVTGRQLAADGVTVDVITGGFPCQDISVAGKQAGITDETRSGLWSEIARLVSELRPRYVIVENVANLLSGPSERPGGWFGRILSDLASLGYDAEWHCIPASHVGAPHQRDRIWVIAYPSCKPMEELKVVGPGSGSWEVHGQPGRVGRKDGVAWTENKSPVLGVAHGFPDWVDRCKGLGNCVVPAVVTLVGNAILEAHPDG